MKRVLLVIVMVLNFISCSKEKSTLNEDFPHSFILTKMTGSFEGSETTGNAMEWQESYCLFENNTFIKSRNWNGTNIDAEGTYSFTIIENENFIEFTYNAESTIIGSCYGNLKEFLYILNDYEVNGTWSHCDGPGLVYKRSQVCAIN